MVFGIWKNVRVTSPYGWRDRNGGEMHHGIDMATFRGDNVPCFYPGKVVHAKLGAAGTGLGDYGIVVVIEDKHGNYQLYAHLDATKLSVGQTVKQGDLIGFMGNTGASDAPHLHFEVRTKGASWGWRITSDPELYLNLLNEIDSKKKTIDGLGTYDVNDGKPIESIIVEGTMYAPIRDTAESLGAKVVDYDNIKKHAKIRG